MLCTLNAAPPGKELPWFEGGGGAPPQKVVYHQAAWRYAVYHPGGTHKWVCQGTVFLWTCSAGRLALDTVPCRTCLALDIVQHRTYPSPMEGGWAWQLKPGLISCTVPPRGGSPKGYRASWGTVPLEEEQCFSVALLNGTPRELQSGETPDRVCWVRLPPPHHEGEADPLG